LASPFENGNPPSRAKAMAGCFEPPMAPRTHAA
jgi:hypothetical protein